MDKLAQLENILNVLDRETITSDEFIKNFELVIEFVKQTRDLTTGEVKTLAKKVEKSLEQLHRQNEAEWVGVKNRVAGLKDGKTPTTEELLDLIVPLIPPAQNGKDADEEMIVDKVFSRIEIPTYDEVNPDSVVEKVNFAKKKIKKDRIEGLEDLEKKADFALQRPIMMGGGGEVLDIRAGTNTTISKRGGIYTISSIGDGTGDVHGPAGATANAIPLFDGVTGKLLKDSAKTIVTVLGADDTTVPTSKAVADAILAEDIWDRTGTVISPNTAGDSLDMGTASVTTPLILGGTSTTQDLSFKTTSGVGAAGADMHFLVGNNGGTEAMTILNSGNVGIGTTSPGFTLDVQGTTGYMQVKATTGTNNAYTQYNNTGGNFWIGRNNSAGTGLVTTGGIAYSAILNAFGTYPMQFATNNSVAMTILNGGNVGIGTTSPGQILHIYGTTPEPMIEGNNSRVGLQLKGGQTGDANWILYSGYPSAGDFTIRESGVASHLVVKKTTGNVGIGTSSPNARLQVVGGDVNIDTQRYFRIGGEAVLGGNTVTRNLFIGTTAANFVTEIYAGQGGAGAVPRITIDTNGNVGIGTTAPTAKLQVNGNLATTMQSTTLAAAATAIAVTSNVVKVTGDAGANTVATITGGVSGQVLTLIFVDALVTITDTAAATANTVNLSAAFTGAANTTLTLVYDGNKWFETARSVNG